MTTISRSEGEAEAKAPEKPLFYERDGKSFWECLRCGGEHEIMTSGQHVQVGNTVVGITCNGCADVVRREIVALIPERSFHGQHVD